MTEPKCETCGGLGYVDGEADDFSHGGGHFTRSHRVECPDCEAGAAWAEAESKRLGADLHEGDEES